MVVSLISWGRNPRSMLLVTLSAAIISLIPALFHTDADTYFVRSEQDVVRRNVKADFFQYVAFGAVMCCIPLLLDAFIDTQISKSITFSSAQWMLLSSIVVPCGMLLVQVACTEGVSLVVFSLSANIMEIFFVGSLLAFHSLGNDHKKHNLRYSCFAINFIYMFGSLLICFYNLGFGDNISNGLGLFLIYCGIFAIFVMFIYQVSRNVDMVQSGWILRKNVLYITVLVFSILARILFYIFASGNGDEKQVSQEAYFIIINTMSVLLLSIYHSRNIKSGFIVTKSRLEAKRNFVRFISHEIRTPLNTVSMGLQLVIRDMKVKMDAYDDGLVGKHACEGIDSCGHAVGITNGSAVPVAATARSTVTGEFNALRNRGTGSLHDVDTLVDMNAPTKTSGQNSQRSNWDSAGSSDKKNNSNIAAAMVESAIRYKTAVAGFLKLVEESNDSCEIAIDILNDILTYDKLDSNDLKLHTREISVHELVLSNCKGFLNQARNLRVNLNLLSGPADLEMDLRNVYVDVDAAKIGQVCRNLISNALKFTPAEGRIDVTARFVREMSIDSPYYSNYVSAVAAGGGSSGSMGSFAQPNSSAGNAADISSAAGDIESASSSSGAFASFQDRGNRPRYIRIDVKDSGVGLSKENQQKLFDGVVQFEDRASINRFGAGLGLYISKQIMDMHNCYLTVQSEGVPGQGSTFSVFLRVCRVNDEEIFDDQMHDNEGVMDTSISLRGSLKGSSLLPKNGSNALGSFMNKFSTMRSQAYVTPSVLELNNDGADSSPSKHHLSLNSEVEGSSEKESHTPDGNFGSVHEPAGPPPPTSVANIHKVLIVDDSLLNRKLLGRFLQSYYDVVLFAEDGVVAMTLLAEAIASGSPVQLVLMDNVMPNLDGLQTARAIRRLTVNEGSTVPIIGVTGNGLPDQISEFIAHGANAVLQKPVKFEKLQQTILSVMKDRVPASLAEAVTTSV